MTYYDAEVEYLESDGNQFIDTGFCPNQDTGLKAELAFGTFDYWEVILGCREKTDTKEFTVQRTNGYGTLRALYGLKYTRNQLPNVATNRFSLNWNKRVVTVNNTTYTFESQTFTCPYTLYLYGLHSSTSQYYKGKFWYCQIYDNDTLVRDFIPVRIGSVGYMYDKVSDTLFGNSGTGSFILGSDVAGWPGVTGKSKVSSIRRLMILFMSKHIPNYLCFTALEKGTFTITIDSALGTGTLQYIEYSIDDCKTWVRTDNVNSEQVVVTTPTIKAGKKVYWRGIGSQLAQNFSNKPTIVSSTCRFDASGEVLSLLKGENFETSRGVGNSAFARLFLNCTTLVNTKDLIIHVGGMGSYGLLEMFKGCTSLITTPHIMNVNSVYAFNNMFQNCTSLVEVTYPLPIPATVANRAYRAMFSGCASLIKTPDLPLTEFGSSAYQEMFYGCTSLVEVPSILPATSLTSSCYSSMFYGCKSLETAPKLPATSVPASGYHAMFAACTKLINVPDIITNNVGNAAFQGMFQGCSSLTYSPIKKLPNASASALHSTFRDCTLLTEAPELPAEVLNTYCYINAFRNTKISYIKMLATDISATGCLDYWLYTVPNVSTSIFVKNINATWTTTGNSGVPTNWTVIYYDPSEDKYYTSQDKSQECDDHGNPI